MRRGECRRAKPGWGLRLGRQLSPGSHPRHLSRPPPSPAPWLAAPPHCPLLPQRRGPAPAAPAAAAQLPALGAPSTLHGRETTVALFLRHWQRPLSIECSDGTKAGRRGRRAGAQAQARSQAQAGTHQSGRAPLRRCSSSHHVFWPSAELAPPPGQRSSPTAPAPQGGTCGACRLGASGGCMPACLAPPEPLRCVYRTPCGCSCRGVDTAGTPHRAGWQCGAATAGLCRAPGFLLCSW